MFLYRLWTTPPVQPQTIIHVSGSIWQNSWSNFITNSWAFTRYFERQEVNTCDMHNCLMALPLLLQKTILNEMLSNFFHPLVQKIVSLENKDLRYNVLLALMARHQLIEGMGDWLNQNPIASLHDYFTRGNVQFSAIINALNAAPGQTLIRDIMTEQVKLLQGYNSNYEGNQVTLVTYFADLPFPLNIKCLSEALNMQTSWSVFFDDMPENMIIDYRAYINVIITNKLAECMRVTQTTNAWNNTIAPEIKAIMVNRPDLIKHASKIWCLLFEPVLSPNSRVWGETLQAKRVIWDFIQAIPDTNKRREYLQAARRPGTPLNEFFRTRVLTLQDQFFRFFLGDSQRRNFRVEPALPGRVVGPGGTEPNSPENSVRTQRLV